MACNLWQKTTKASHVHGHLWMNLWLVPLSYVVTCQTCPSNRDRGPLKTALKKDGNPLTVLYLLSRWTRDGECIRKQKQPAPCWYGCIRLWHVWVLSCCKEWMIEHRSLHTCFADDTWSKVKCTNLDRGIGCYHADYYRDWACPHDSSPMCRDFKTHDARNPNEWIKQSNQSLSHVLPFEAFSKATLFLLF